MDGGVSELAYDIHGNIYPSDEGGCSPAGAMSRSDWGTCGSGVTRMSGSGWSKPAWGLRAAQPASFAAALLAVL